MSQETVIIGCRLPNGLILEVGLQTTATVDGKQVAQVRRLDSYQKIVLKGWNSHSEEMRRNEIQVPAGMNTKPFLNRGVSKDAWEEWKRTHPGSWLIKNGILFEAKGEADAQVKALDVAKEPLILAPLNKAQLPAGIAEADFAKKTGT
jgi:hypothetical protein